MKRTFIYLVSFLFILAGCNKNNIEDELSGTRSDSAKEKTNDGDWEDVIGLSTKTVQFTGRKDTVHIQTEGLGWCFETITVDGTQYEITLENKEAQLEEHEFFKVCDWLTIHREANDITLIATSNITNEKRTFELSLRGGDYFDSIKGTQELRLDGDWNDCIGLSKKKVEYTAEGGTITVDTKDTGWWLNRIEVDGIDTYIEVDENDLIIKGEEYRKKCDWLTVNTSNQKIKLSVEPNTTGKERAFKVYMQAGNYFDSIEGIQAK